MKRSECQCQIRTAVYALFRDPSRPSSAAEFLEALVVSPEEVSSTFRSLAEEYSILAPLGGNSGGITPTPPEDCEIWDEPIENPATAFLAVNLLPPELPPGR